MAHLSNPPLVSVFAGAIAVGIRRPRRWVRPLVGRLWVTLAMAAIAGYSGGDLARFVLVRALIEPAVLTALCGWYFWGKPNVVAYFRSL